jgi:hypothetical protein
MDLEDSRCPPGALPLRQAMQAWLPEKVLAEVRAAGDDLNRNARQVYRIDEQGRRIFEIDAHSDFNRPLLLRMQEAQDAAGAAFLALLRAGRLVAWAREGSPATPPAPAPATPPAPGRLAPAVPVPPCAGLRWCTAGCTGSKRRIQAQRRPEVETGVGFASLPRPLAISTAYGHRLAEGVGSATTNPPLSHSTG